MWGGAAFIVRERGIESGFIFLGTENVSTTMGKFTDSFKDGVSMRAFYRFFYKLDSDNFVALASVAGVDLRDLWGFEMYHTAALTPLMHLSTDLQLINNEHKGDSIADVDEARLVNDFFMGSTRLALRCINI